MKQDTTRRNLSGIYIFDTLPQDERRRIDALTIGHTTCVTSYALHEDLVSEINRFCRLFRLLADMAGVCARDSESDRRQKEEEEAAQ